MGKVYLSARRQWLSWNVEKELFMFLLARALRTRNLWPLSNNPVAEPMFLKAAELWTPGSMSWSDLKLKSGCSVKTKKPKLH